MVCVAQLGLVCGAAPPSRDSNSLNTTSKSLLELEDLQEIRTEIRTELGW